MSLTGTSSSDKLICAISGHGQGERLMRRAREAGARGGTLLPGRHGRGGLWALLCLATGKGYTHHSWFGRTNPGGRQSLARHPFRIPYGRRNIVQPRS